MDSIEFDKDLEFIFSKFKEKSKHIRRISTEHPYYCVHITGKKGFSKIEEYLYFSEHDLEYLT